MQHYYGNENADFKSFSPRKGCELQRTHEDITEMFSSEVSVPVRGVSCNEEKTTAEKIEETFQSP